MCKVSANICLALEGQFAPQKWDELNLSKIMIYVHKMIGC